MKTSLNVFFASCVVLGVAACGGGTSSADSTKEAKKQNDSTFDSTSIKKDASFAVAAADGGMLEVQLGQLAQTNGTSAAIKELGKMMVDDHSKANDELKAVAERKGIVLPAVMGDKNQKTYNDLALKKGAEFDKSYADLMVSDHNDDIEEFKKEANVGEDPDLKAWAQGKVPVLEHHLEMAKTTQEAVKKSK